MRNTAAFVSPERASQTPPYPSGRYAWYVVLILYLAYTFSFIDRSIPAPDPPGFCDK
jgi:hypothetical protein